MNSTDKTESIDRHLIQRCRKGELKAWQELLDRYERLVFSIPLNYGLSREDAADIAQLTFTILLQALDTLRENSRLGPWLATVARRHTWRLLARQRRESVGQECDISEQADWLAADNPDFVTRSETIQWLDRGLSLLDERCRQLLLALYFGADQPSYEEVANRLGMPVGSIGPTRARCLQRLRQILE